MAFWQLSFVMYKPHSSSVEGEKSPNKNHLHCLIEELLRAVNIQCNVHCYPWSPSSILLSSHLFMIIMIIIIIIIVITFFFFFFLWLQFQLKKARWCVLFLCAYRDSLIKSSILWSWLLIFPLDILTNVSVSDQIF